MAIKDVEAVEHHGDDRRWRQTTASGRSGGLEWFKRGERAGERNVIELAKPPSPQRSDGQLRPGRVTLVNGAKMHVLPCTEWSPMHWEADEEKRVVG
jgi:hypothetical protein